MTPIQWINEGFVVIDAWQTIHLGALLLARDKSPWIVIARRHPDGRKWYLFSRDEFISYLRDKDPSISVEDTLHLREH
jgi:hypothetical protein